MEIEIKKEKLVKVCRRLAENGFVAATDGNVSVRLDDGNIVVTPSGKSKSEVEVSDLIIVNLDGKIISGTGRPSTEFAMHSFIYRKRPDVGAVIHAHPVYATAFAASRIPLDKLVFPEVIVTLGKVPLADYATPSTSEVVKSIEPLIKEYDAILLANHGVVTCGASLDEACNKMEKVEHTATIAFIAKQLGGAKELTKDEIERLASVSEKSYGKRIDLRKLLR